MDAFRQPVHYYEDGIVPVGLRKLSDSVKGDGVPVGAWDLVGHKFPHLLWWEGFAVVAGITPCNIAGNIVGDCQSMTLHIELCAFLIHLQCISKALPHTLMHCVLDSACYATPPLPLHPRLCMCHLCLFVCLFTFITGTCVACFVCLFPLP